MTNLRRRSLIAQLGPLSLCLLPAPARPETPLRRWLSAPGAILLLRHAQTVPGLGDPEGFRLEDCSTQRNLSEAGRVDSSAWGAWLSQLGIKPARVRSSQWCRCLDTARLMFPQQTVQPWPALNSYFQGHGDRAAQLRLARSEAVRLAQEASGFEVWVTHQVVITDLTGEYTGMGEAVVARASSAAQPFAVLGRSSGPR